MRRAIFPLALVLALVTGAVLHATRVVVLAPAVALDGDPEARAHAALIRRFYVAVNEVLATGNTVQLDDILDADLVDHAVGPVMPPGRDGFVRSLRSLHEVAPKLQLKVLDVVVQDDRVAARLRVDGGEGAAFLGLPIAPDRLWGAVDVFRVAAGRIAERWGGPAGLASFAPLLTLEVPIEQPTYGTVTLERWTYAPRTSETRATDLGFVVLLVDAGTLTVEVTSGADGADSVAGGKKGTAGDGRAPTPGPPKFLKAGDAVVIPQGGRIAVRNDGAVPAVVLAVVAAVPAPSEGPMAGAGGAKPTGVDHQILAGGPAANLPAGQATIAIGRVALASRAGLPSHMVGIAELALVESGTLALADSGRAWVTSLPNAGPRRSNEGPVRTGAGVRVDRGNVVGYHNAGDDQLALLLVTVGAAPIETGTPAP
jgi:predicted ester cyclase